MVMNNEFGHDFVRKMMQRKTIEQELEKIAHMQMKNAKYNIYKTKAQAMRDEKTLNTIQDRQHEAEVNAYFEANHIPMMAGTKMSPGLARSMSSKSPRTSDLLRPKKEYSVKAS